MAIDKQIFKILKKKVDWTGRDLLMLGRQTDCRGRGRDKYCEDLFRGLGCNDVESIDISKTENPTKLWDLNIPIPQGDIKGEKEYPEQSSTEQNYWYFRQYDIIYDGGTLEHVYNVPNALENVRRLLKPGGTFVSNQLLNVAGHGFWGISPELLHLWCKYNGFLYTECWAFWLRLPVVREIELHSYKRSEIFSFLPSAYIFVARNYQPLKDGVEIPNPIQSGPNMISGRFQYWFRDTNLLCRARQ